VPGGDEVVTVADDELFGQDGTQPPPAPPFLSDPLSGLVTGQLFSDTTAIADVSALYPDYVYTPVARGRTRRSAAPTRTTGPLRAAGAPDAIPVAEPFSGRSGTQQRRPPAARGTPMPIAPAQVAPVTPVRPAPSRTPQTGWPSARTSTAGGMSARPATGRPGTGRPTQLPYRRQRRAGAGCSIFLLLIVIMVIAFVVLGILLGHSGPGGSGGGL
jgi:hypothetical protein